MLLGIYQGLLLQWPLAGVTYVEMSPCSWSLQICHLLRWWATHRRGGATMEAGQQPEAKEGFQAGRSKTIGRRELTNPA